MGKEMLKRAAGVGLSKHMPMLMSMLMLASNWAIARHSYAEPANKWRRSYQISYSSQVCL
jgi:hypothetical protein